MYRNWRPLSHHSIPHPLSSHWDHSIHWDHWVHWDHLAVLHCAGVVALRWTGPAVVEVGGGGVSGGVRKYEGGRRTGRGDAEEP